jgi:hypothetical protein
VDLWAEKSSLERSQCQPSLPHRSARPFFLTARYASEALLARVALVSVLLFATGARAGSPAAVVRTLQAASACVGGCSAPRLVRVDDRLVVALWRGDDHTLYAQGVDVRAGIALGTPENLGKLFVVGSRESRALQVYAPRDRGHGFHGIVITESRPS